MNITSTIDQLLVIAGHTLLVITPYYFAKSITRFNLKDRKQKLSTYELIRNSIIPIVVSVIAAFVCSMVSNEEDEPIKTSQGFPNWIMLSILFSFASLLGTYSIIKQHSAKSLPYQDDFINADNGKLEN